MTNNQLTLKGDIKNQVDKRNKLNDLSNKEWMIRTKSVFFSKPEPRDKLKKQHPATFAESDIKEQIEFFTKKGEHVFDPFVGVGSTMVAAKNTNRKSTGVELTKQWADLAKLRVGGKINSSLSNIEQSEHNLFNQDIENFLKKCPNDLFDFIITSPPYWSILRNKAHKAKRERTDKALSTHYSEDKNDLGNMNNYAEFIDKLADIFIGCAQKLKSKKHMCIIVSDFKSGKIFYPYHSDLVNKIMEKKDSLELCGISILVQNNKNLYPYGIPYAYVPNISHQYILILRKTM